MSDSVRPHRRQPTRLPHPWDSPRQEHWSGLSFPSPMHESEKWKVKVKSLSRVQTPSNPMDCSFPGSSVHGIFQARVLEWGVIAFSELSCLGVNNFTNLFSVYVFLFLCLPVFSSISFLPCLNCSSISSFIVESLDYWLLLYFIFSDIWI